MTTRGKKVLFTVQGEGRGHLTQAITLQDILLNSGYEICGVLVGTSKSRALPDFFYKQIKAPIIKFASPNFIFDDKRKSIRIIRSIFFNLGLMPTYFKNMRMVNKQLKTLQPDLIINFYDPLIGFYYLLFNPKIKMLCIAHQYIYYHPDFKFPEKYFFFEKLGLKIFTWLTSTRAEKRLALSMYKLPHLAESNTYVIPPLLRHDVYETEVKDGSYILIYLLNSGYVDDIISWHNANPNIRLHCFTDKKEVVDEWKYDENLVFHQINDKKFLELMAGCQAFATTAGFESICEAMYLGKPVFMVPVEKHFEQYSNARDAARAGAGIYDSQFDLNKLIEYLPNHKTDPEIFRSWAQKTSTILLDHINEIISEEVPVSNLDTSVVFVRERVKNN
jgi:uncharacterized protein (TIGR00661 family)